MTKQTEDDQRDPSVRAATKCTIWLSYTSNMISTGVRESIRYIVEHNLVDVLVTTAGGIEEDIMKCMTPHYIGDFALRYESATVTAPYCGLSLHSGCASVFIAGSSFA